jgi:LDH2 family malate/lactate/ureidoglycolate dehydrogenase
MLALDVARFTDPALFQSRVNSFLKEIRNQEPADPARPPLAPGDPERLTAEQRTKNGIPLGNAVLAELNALGAELGVAKL